MRDAVRRGGWTCPFVMLGAAAGILMLWGLSVWTAVLVAVLLVCPAIMAWGAIQTLRHPAALPLEPAPETRGMSLNWAAPFYDRWCARTGLGEPFRAETLRHAALRPGERVLDVGCGTGVLTRLAAEAVGPTGQADGIDPAPKMIARARENAAREGSRVGFRLGVIERLPFEDRSFDVVLASLMIHHLPPDLKRGGLQEVHRVLKPGGRFIVVDFDWSRAHPVWRMLAWPLRMAHMLRDHAAGRLTPYFVEAGFRPVEVVGRWRWSLSFWVARKPDEARGPERRQSRGPIWQTDLFA